MHDRFPGTRFQIPNNLTGHHRKHHDRVRHAHEAKEILRSEGFSKSWTYLFSGVYHSPSREIMAKLTSVGDSYLWHTTENTEVRFSVSLNDDSSIVKKFEVWERGEYSLGGAGSNTSTSAYGTRGVDCQVGV